jgi:formylglycine-generating enzyme required for sulfatase activity
MEQGVPYLLGQLIGALVPTFLVSRLLLWLLRGWNAGLGRLAFAHILSLLICALIAGMGRADGGAFAPLEAGLAYLLPQGVWFVVDVIRARARGWAAHVSTASNSAAPPPPAIPASGTPGARAWALIQSSLDPADYNAFEAHFPGTPEVLLAARHRRQLEAWAQVDHDSAEAREAFLQTQPFEALARLARGEASNPSEPQPADAELHQRHLGLQVAAASIILAVLSVAFFGFYLQPNTDQRIQDRERQERIERIRAMLADQSSQTADPESLALSLLEQRIRDERARRAAQQAQQQGQPEPDMVRIPGPDPTQPGQTPSIPLPDMVRMPGQNFEVGRYEVTFAEWDACVAEGGCNGYRPDDEGWGRGSRPVINVSWNDAQAYMQWLSERTGERYRLLTAAEWEIAARAGTTTEYSWGDEPPVCDQNARNGANFTECTDDRTRPVGSFQPNGFGLYDVHGNVWEWVQDSDGAGRVLRGGSWGSLPEYLRSAYRGWYNPTLRSGNSGFRLARTL